MAKLNTPSGRGGTLRAGLTAPVRSTSLAPTGLTYEGGAGWERTVQGELFLLAVTNFVGEDTFYEGSSERDARFRELVRECAVRYQDWTARMLGWLRGVANMRTASIVGAAEYVKARLELRCGHRGCTATSVPWTDADEAHWCDQHRHSLTVQPSVSNADVIASVLQRADEPGELVAYWTSRYGLMPMPVKKGIGRAVARLWNEYSLLKYDSPDRAVRWGDVVELVHPPKPRWAALELSDDELATKRAWWDALMKHAIDRRSSYDDPIPETLYVLGRRAELMSVPVENRRKWLEGMIARDSGAQALRRRGMTWEALAGWLQGPMDREAWEAVIPTMGIMALIRNLRNFDEQGVSDEIAEKYVISKLRDPEAVAASRQLPMRWLSAYRAAVNDRWKHPLGVALDASLANIPELSGRTLILTDTSYSMNAPFSRDGSLMRWDSATVFGLALARRCEEVDVVSFSDGTRPFPLKPGESLLASVERWKNDGYFLAGGTATGHAVQTTYRKHDRVVILTDEQASGWGGPTPDEAVPAQVPLYTWNLAGYRHGHAPSGAGNRFVFGGLTDAAFGMIALLERGKNADWPF